MTLKGSALEAIEKINKPFSLHWHPGNPGRWEAILDDGELIRASSIGIVRHAKIRGRANPFDPKYDAFFRKRRYWKTYGQRTCLV